MTQEPPDPAPAEPPTSLELEASTDRVAQPTSLELEPAAEAATPTASLESAQQTADRPSGPLGNLVVAHLQRIEVAMLGRVLATTLAGALPPSVVRVQRHRTVVQWLTRQPGQVVGVSITGGDTMLSFRVPTLGVTEATVGHVVRGVVLSTEQIPVGDWIDRLGDLLSQLARRDEATRVALERALTG